MKKLLTFLLFVQLSFISFSQYEKDTSIYTLFRDKIVLYSDLGFATAPIVLKYPYNNDVGLILLQTNTTPVIGFGLAHQWFSLRLGLTLKKMSLPTGKFGQSSFFDLGLKFQLKKFYFEVDLQNYTGYFVTNSYKWNDSLTAFSPHDIRPKTNAASFSFNSWYFHNKDFKIAAVNGKKGIYNKSIGTLYIKPSLVLHGIGNGAEAIVPQELISSNSSLLASNQFYAVDFGIIPGYAYVLKSKNWQFCSFLGFGAAIQSKFKKQNEIVNSGIGIVPRYDMKFVITYSRPRYFITANADFDNKSLQFNKFKYSQRFISMRGSIGIRLNKSEIKRINPFLSDSLK